MSERDEYEKLQTVIRAALQNPGYRQDLQINTYGHEPSAAIKINAGLLDRWLKPPKTTLD